MAENNVLANQNQPKEAEQSKVISIVKKELEKDVVKKKFEDILGEKAPQFTASLLNLINANAALQKSDPGSILCAAFVAATYDLPIDNNLGFSAIVPYYNSKFNEKTRQWDKRMEAQFQIMYKGFIQLATRSGYYEKMNCSAVYEDELVSYNPILGEAEFVSDFSACNDRKSGDDSKIVGYYAWFKLNTGFKHELYMSNEEIRNHALKYSKSFRKDVDENKKSSLWSTNFKAMALKTVIKTLLSKWGILSIQMQKAIINDQEVYDEQGKSNYSDNQPDDPGECIDTAWQEVNGEATEEPAQENPNEIGGLELEEA